VCVCVCVCVCMCVCGVVENSSFWANPIIPKLHKPTEVLCS